MPLSDSDTDAPRPLTPTDPDGVTTGSLESLQSDEQRKILDIVDHLRRQGLSGVVELPQIVVVSHTYTCTLRETNTDSVYLSVVWGSEQWKELCT